MRTRTRGLLILATTCLALVTATGCGGGSDESRPAAGNSSARTTGDPKWDRVVRAAEREGRVVMYSVMLPVINERLEKAFEEAYPKIDLKITRVLGDKIDSTLDAERTTKRGGADIVDHTNLPWIQRGLKEGYFVDAVGPNATKPEWTGEYLQDGKLQSSLFTVLGLATNKSVIETEVKDYTDLLKPELKGGKIGVVDPFVPSLAAFYAFLEDNYGGEQFLRDLAAQEPIVYQSAVPMEQALIAGEIAVGSWVTSAGIKDAASKGAPVDFVFPPNAFAAGNTTYILTWARHPNAAQVVMDFLATREGQTAIAKDNVSALDGIDGTLGSASQVSSGDVEKQLTNAEWGKRYYDRWQDIFGR
jgi:iron(III) transport system substrate-binding protein